MTVTTGRGTALVVRWSPHGVRVYDPALRQWLAGATISECLHGTPAAREVVVAVDQRSALVRCLSVPNISREEIAKMMAFKLGPLLPLAPAAFVTGFRLSAEDDAKGRRAVVGAVKADSLRKIYDEVEGCGLKVRAVLPLAFASWLAARSHALVHCAVVESTPDGLSIDIISQGELNYSRSAPPTDAPDEIDAEIARTFQIAEVTPGVVLSLASPSVGAEIVDTRDSLEYLTDPGTIDRLLFSLELRERVAARAAKAERRTAGLALAIAVLAFVLGGNAYWTQSQAAGQAEKARKAQIELLKKTQAAGSETAKRLANVRKQRHMMDAAFAPAQSFKDIVTTLAEDAPADMWFTGLTLEHGKPVLLHGSAKSDHAIAKFVAALNHDPRFRDPKIVSANTATIGKQSVVQFSLSTHAVGNFPLDDVPKLASATATSASPAATVPITGAATPEGDTKP